MAENRRKKGVGGPSKSGDAASLLQGKSAFQAFASFGAFGAASEQFESVVDANLRITFKKLTKKDPTTKLKALTEMHEFFTNDAQHPLEELVTLLPEWCIAFLRLAVDGERRVREQSLIVLSELVSRVKKQFGPHLKSIMPAWLLCMNDPCREVATAARRAFESSFPADKRLSVLLLCMDEIVKLLRENFRHSVQTLSDMRSATQEEAEEKYERVVSASLLSLQHMLETFPSDEISKLSSSLFYDDLFSPSFMKLSSIKFPLIRSSFFSFLSSVLRKLPDLSRDFIKLFAPVILGSFSEKESFVHRNLWECVLTAMKLYPEVWTHVNVRKQVLPRLWSFLRGEAPKSAETSYPCLLPFLTLIPRDIIGTPCIGFFDEFLSNAWKSIYSDQLVLHNLASVLEAYSECLVFVVRNAPKYASESEPQELIISSVIEKHFGEYMLTHFLSIKSIRLRDDSFASKLADTINRLTDALKGKNEQLLWSTFSSTIESVLADAPEEAEEAGEEIALATLAQVCARISSLVKALGRCANVSSSTEAAKTLCSLFTSFLIAGSEGSKHHLETASVLASSFGLDNVIGAQPPLSFFESTLLPLYQSLQDLAASILASKLKKKKKSTSAHQQYLLLQSNNSYTSFESTVLSLFIDFFKSKQVQASELLPSIWKSFVDTVIADSGTDSESTTRHLIFVLQKITHKSSSPSSIWHTDSLDAMAIESFESMLMAATAEEQESGPSASTNLELEKLLLTTLLSSSASSSSPLITSTCLNHLIGLASVFCNQVASHARRITSLVATATLLPVLSLLIQQPMSSPVDKLIASEATRVASFLLECQILDLSRDDSDHLEQDKQKEFISKDFRLESFPSSPSASASSSTSACAITEEDLAVLDLDDDVETDEAAADRFKSLVQSARREFLSSAKQTWDSFVASAAAKRLIADESSISSLADLLIKTLCDPSSNLSSEDASGIATSLLSFTSSFSSHLAQNLILSEQTWTSLRSHFAASVHIITFGSDVIFAPNPEKTSEAGTACLVYSRFLRYAVPLLAHHMSSSREFVIPQWLILELFAAYTCQSVFSLSTSSIVSSFARDVLFPNILRLSSAAVAAPTSVSLSASLVPICSLCLSPQASASFGSFYPLLIRCAAGPLLRLAIKSERAGRNEDVEESQEQKRRNPSAAALTFTALLQMFLDSFKDNSTQWLVQLVDGFSVAFESGNNQLASYLTVAAASSSQPQQASIMALFQSTLAAVTDSAPSHESLDFLRALHIIITSSLLDAATMDEDSQRKALTDLNTSLISGVFKSLSSSASSTIALSPIALMVSQALLTTPDASSLLIQSEDPSDPSSSSILSPALSLLLDVTKTASESSSSKQQHSPEYFALSFATARFFTSANLAAVSSPTLPPNRSWDLTARTFSQLLFLFVDINLLLSPVSSASASSPQHFRFAALSLAESLAFCLRSLDAPTLSALLDRNVLGDDSAALLRESLGLVLCSQSSESQITAYQVLSILTSLHAWKLHQRFEAQQQSSKQQEQEQEEQKEKGVHARHVLPASLLSTLEHGFLLPPHTRAQARMLPLLSGKSSKVSQFPHLLMGFFLSWQLLLDFRSSTSGKIRLSSIHTGLQAYCKHGDLIDGLLNSACLFFLRPINKKSSSSSSRKVKPQDDDQERDSDEEEEEEEGHGELADEIESRINRFMIQQANNHGKVSIALLAAHAYATAVNRMPTLVRLWHGRLDRNVAVRVEKYTAGYVSPSVIERELSLIAERASMLMQDAEESFVVKTIKAARQVTATYVKAETVLDLTLKMPETYPLHPLTCESGTRRVGISEMTWRKWMLNMTTILFNQDGSVWDAMLLWKENLDKHFDGVSECVICYSVVHATDRSVPKMQCRTCKNRFHSACLYKWFNTSHNSNCPLCRTQWS